MSRPKHYHLTVGGDTWCDWTGSQAGLDVARKSGVHVCAYYGRDDAEDAAKRLRPYFKRGRVKVVPGSRWARGLGDGLSSTTRRTKIGQDPACRIC